MEKSVEVIGNDSAPTQVADDDVRTAPAVTLVRRDDKGRTLVLDTCWLPKRSADRLEKGREKRRIIRTSVFMVDLRFFSFLIVFVGGWWLLCGRSFRMEFETRICLHGTNFFRVVFSLSQLCLK